MNENQQTQEKLKVKKIFVAFYILAAVCFVIYVIARCVPSFANFFNRYIASIFRGILATVSGILPISVAELLIICIPIILFVVIRIALKYYTADWHGVKIYCISLVSVVALFFGVFVLTFGTGYYTSTLDQRLELDRQDVSANELAATAEWLIENVNKEIDNVEFAEKSSSVMPYSIKDMSKHLMAAYEKVSDKYTFIPKLNSKIKPIMLSEPMTYTHISGVYTYFTGEANLNTNSPDYCKPFTAAHEFAHQRGIAREDEANFIAFLVCTESDDPYIRYCGYLNLCEYVLNALYRANNELWKETYLKLDSRAIYEMIAYNEFYEKYSDNVVGEISGAINDAYLQANGTQGSVSYGLVVDLAVAYFHKNIEN